MTFSQFNLSTSAEMYVYNETKTVLDSAIKKDRFTYSSQVSIASFKGNSIIVYIIEPNNFGTFQSSISIQKLVAGYQNIDEVGDTGGSQFAPQSIDCDPMILCQPSKIIFGRAVARMVTQVSPTKVGYCTGTLINNESNNGISYLLTAFHCIDFNKNNIIDQSEIDALVSSSFQFQFWRTQCNGTINNKYLEFSGAILRASWKNSDFVLLELLNSPGIGDKVNFAGWNRQTNAPADYSSFIIHHPDTKDMRITTASNVHTRFWNNNFWTAHYSSGTVAPGSSGSALMNEYAQIIGQLKAGWSSCTFPDFGDYYGKLDQSWIGGGTNNTRLSNWLSPNQSLQGTAFLNLTDIPINGPNIIACTTPTQYTAVPGLLGVTYQWMVSAGLQIISGQGTGAVTISGLSNNGYGSGILTLNLTSPTKGYNRFYTVSKNIIISTGGSITGTYNSPTNSAQPLVPRPPKNLTQFNAACIAFVTNMAIPSGSTVAWSGTTSSPDIIWYQNGNDVFCNFTAVNQTADLTISITNSCGPSNTRFRFMCTTTNSCGVTPLGPVQVTVSPNPSNNNVMVSLESNANNSNKKGIQEIRIIDKMGNIKQIRKYENGVKSQLLNVSFLIPDLYTILVFDGTSWVSKKFIKN